MENRIMFIRYFKSGFSIHLTGNIVIDVNMQIYGFHATKICEAFDTLEEETKRKTVSIRKKNYKRHERTTFIPSST